jgi:uncharacterized membrane protein
VSIVLYVIAGCFYIAANVIVLKMKSVAEGAGSKLGGFYLNPFEPPGPFAPPGQGKRFAAFGICLVMTTACLLAARGLQLGGG